MDQIKLRRLAGIPVDLSKPENARATVRTPVRLVSEAAKVPQHRGELAPKTKDNMRGRVNHAKKALEALETARDELMDLPAVDYMEDVPTLIKQLHYMLHGEDGTGGVHQLHRHYKHEFDTTVFPEDIDDDKEKAAQDAADAEAGVTDADKGKKGKTNEAFNLAAVEKKAKNPAAADSGKSDGLGFEKEKSGPGVEKKNVRAFKLADGSDKETMYTDDEENIAKDPRERTPTPPAVQENAFASSQDAEDVNNALMSPFEKAKKAAQDEDIAGKELKKNPFEQEEDSEDGTYHDVKRKDGKVVKVFVPTKKPRGEDSEDSEECEFSMPMTMEGKKPKWLEKKEVEAEKKEGKKVSKSEEKKVGVAEGKKPKWLEKKEVEAEEKEGKKVSKAEAKKVGVKEAAGPLFARDAQHPKTHDNAVSVQYPSWGAEGKPVNVVSAEDGVSPYYPDGSKSENASQIPTNPYNENQAVKVPAKIMSSLKSEADIARKLAETFTMRKDWDNKNFHENLANAFDTLGGFLEKGTIYGIKEAQVFMTSLMSPIMNKLPASVVKYVAAGGQQRSLRSYLNDVKEPTTGVVFQQDSNGVK